MFHNEQERGEVKPAPTPPAPQTTGAGEVEAPEAGDGDQARQGLEQQGLERELERLRQEAAELSDKYLRSLADFENFRRRTRRQLEESALDANEALVKKLLPVLDNLARAVDAAAVAPDAASLRRGAEMVLEQFRGILDGLGVKEVKAENEPFDPERHEVLEQVETADADAEGRVVAVLQKGYVFRGRVLRPSLVRVARRKQ